MTVVQLVCVRFRVYSASYHFSRVKLALVFLAVSSLKIVCVPVYGTLLRGCALHCVAAASLQSHDIACLRPWRRTGQIVYDAHTVVIVYNTTGWQTAGSIRTFAAL